MRKTEKSDLYDFFKPDVEPSSLADVTYVIDGGYFLHKVVWGPTMMGKTYLHVANKYAYYMLSKFGYRYIVFFDGYSNPLSAKNTERVRKLQKLCCSDIQVKENNKVTVTQEKFLSNSSNKES